MSDCETDDGIYFWLEPVLKECRNTLSFYTSFKGKGRTLHVYFLFTKITETGMSRMQRLRHSSRKSQPWR
jgi:hypothetical protein